MKRLILILAIAFAISQADGSTKKSYGTLTCTLLEVYDGDTFKCDLIGLHPLIGKRISIRVFGIDTPEIRTKDLKKKAQGLRSKQFASILLSHAKVIELRQVRRGKYFRIIASVYIDGKDFAAIMISEGYAIPYFGGKRK